jgi:hypothetical protein
MYERLLCSSTSTIVSHWPVVRPACSCAHVADRFGGWATWGLRGAWCALLCTAMVKGVNYWSSKPSGM